MKGPQKRVADAGHFVPLLAHTNLCQLIQRQALFFGIIWNSRVEEKHLPNKLILCSKEMFLRILLQLCRPLAVGSCRKKKPELDLFPLLHSFPFLPLLLSNSRGRCRLTSPLLLFFFFLQVGAAFYPLFPAREKEKNFLAGNLLIFPFFLFPFFFAFGQPS